MPGARENFNSATAVAGVAGTVEAAAISGARVGWGVEGRRSNLRISKPAVTSSTGVKSKIARNNASLRALRAARSLE